MNGNSYRMILVRVGLLVVGGIIASGCSSRSKGAIDGEPRARVEVIKAPGVVEHVWEEPMVDVVDVPPGLDPEGHYYRPAHQSIVEIRQGRWRKKSEVGQNE
jgi:hypothetical protein